MDCPCARSRSRYGVSLLWLPRHLPNKTLFLCQQWVALHWSVFLFSPMHQQCSRPGGWGWWQRWRRTRGQVIRLKEQRAIQWFCWPLLINIGCHGNRQVTSSYKTSHYRVKGTVSRYCACTKLWFLDKMSRKSNDVRRVRELLLPFASRFAEFNTTLKCLRITDQWYIVLVKFLFGRNREFLAVLLLSLAGGPKDGKCFDADWRLISPASFHTSSDNCQRNTQKWNSNN